MQVYMFCLCTVLSSTELGSQTVSFLTSFSFSSLVVEGYGSSIEETE